MVGLQLNRKIIHKLGILLLLLFGLIVIGQSQEESGAIENLYLQTEKIYSTDDLLVNGQFYIPSRPRAKGSPYYGEKQFVAGSVQIKGRKFDGVLLMYDIENQHLILRAAVESGKYITILLNSDLIDYFVINRQQFVNADKYNDEKFHGFFAVVYSGNFDFLIKYNKEFTAVYNNQTPNGSYTKMKSYYFIFDEGHLIKVSKKKSFLSYFSLHKKEINTFMRKHKIRYKKAGAEVLNQLMKYCDSVSAHK
jgi:hypothetical protein